MRRPRLPLTLAAILLALLAIADWSSRTRACGPFFRRAVFVLQRHPDFPLDRFAAGRLGIVAPTWARSQLFVAYRYLSGEPLDAAERQAVLALWQARLYPGGPDAYTLAPASWHDARETVPGAAPMESFKVFRYLPKTFNHYLNCPADAFVTASRTLTARIEQFGAASEAVADWLRAQDQVFANCAPSDDAEAPEPRLPAPAPPSLPPIIRADRAYQVASALFYGGRFEEAARAFATVAADADSPWQPFGRYLEARALVRQGTINEDPASLFRAETLLRELAADPATPQLGPAVGRLLGFVRARTAPVERVRELGTQLAQPARGPVLEQELWDYTVLLDGLVEPIDLARPAGRRSGPPPRSPEAPLLPDADDLTDWILTFQGYHPPRRALVRWDQARSPAWLVAAISLMDATDPAVPAVIAAARALPPGSPAYPTAVHHAARLLIETGQSAAARDLLDAGLPAARRDWPRSAVNALLAQRAAVASGLDEFAGFSLREPTLFTFDEDGRELPAQDAGADSNPRGAVAAGVASLPLLGDDAAITINEGLPLSRLIALARSTALPVEWRQAVARAAWVRAALLDAPADGRRAARIVAGDRSNATSALRPLLATYLSATTTGDRRFAAVFAILRNPGTSPLVRGGLPRAVSLDRIDNYRDNWWCTPPDPSDLPPDGLFPPRTDRVQASAELSALAALGPAPNHLARQVLDYAREHPDDARVPEALALAVKATRFGCVDAGTTKWSRAAFTLLHKEYGTTTWARATRYYY